MYVIAGATGRVGSVTAKNLLAEDADVRVLVRRPSDAEHWKKQGAETRVVQLDDRAALTDALNGATGFFAHVPFCLTAASIDAHAEILIIKIAGAVADANVPHVVMLASAAADHAEGTGAITGLF